MAVYLPFFQKALQLTAISWYEWSLILAISLFVILIIEIVKWVFLIRRKKYA